MNNNYSNKNNKNYKSNNATLNCSGCDEEEANITDVMGLDKSDYPFPWLYEHYKALENRWIYITKDIDESLVEEQKMIIRWNIEDEKAGIPIEERKKIVIFLYSYGGDGDQCLSMIDTIKLSKTPIIMCCLGIAMSAGAMIFISAPKGNRYIFPNSVILLHQGSSSSGGTAQQVLDQADNYKHFLNRMKEITLENTEIPSAMYAKKAKKEWYIYADAAISLGCADHIVTSLTELM